MFQKVLLSLPILIAHHMADNPTFHTLSVAPKLYTPFLLQDNQTNFPIPFTPQLLSSDFFYIAIHRIFKLLSVLERLNSIIILSLKNILEIKRDKNI